MFQNMSDKKNSKQPVGSETIPPPQNVRSLQALMKLRPNEANNKISVFGFALNRDMIKEDGTLDELHAVVIPLGSFHDVETAEKELTEIMSKTGHPGIIWGRYGQPIPLTTKFNPENINEIALDAKGRVVELESAQYIREKKEFERRQTLEKEVTEEAERETDKDDIEHFKRQCYLAIKNKATWEHHKDLAKQYKDNFIKRKEAVKDHYMRHPEHERDWLPYLKEKLAERGELELYSTIEAGYKCMREELLELKHPEI
jgi:hypothetical protein